MPKREPSNVSDAMTPWYEHRWAWLVLLAVAGTLYLSYSPSYYVGQVGDDAIYIAGAKSILHGSYSAFYSPGHPPLTIYPPGYSLILAPFVKMEDPHWELLKLVSIALTLLNGALFWLLLRTWGKSEFRLLALGLFLFNPVTVHCSIRVMSDPFFTTMVLVSFLLLEKVLDQTKDST